VVIGYVCALCSGGIRGWFAQLWIWYGTGWRVLSPGRVGGGWTRLALELKEVAVYFARFKVATVKGVLDCPDGVGSSGRSVILYNMAADAPMEIASST